MFYLLLVASSEKANRLKSSWVGREVSEIQDIRLFFNRKVTAAYANHVLSERMFLPIYEVVFHRNIYYIVINFIQSYLEGRVLGDLSKSMF